MHHFVTHASKYVSSCSWAVHTFAFLCHVYIATNLSCVFRSCDCRGKIAITVTMYKSQMHNSLRYQKFDLIY